MTNHGDKRSVSTDALETLGSIIGPGQGRDAIHLAVEPVVAAEDLVPGEHVGFIDGGVGCSDTPLGIVDPFLALGPRKGEYFWLVVYPRQITSLRHVWTHPKFPEPSNVSIVASQDVINRAAAAIGVSTASLLYGLEWYLKEGDPHGYVGFGEEIDARELPDGFWPHYEAVTGKKVPEEMRDVHFQCAC